MVRPRIRLLLALAAVAGGAVAGGAIAGGAIAGGAIAGGAVAGGARPHRARPAGRATVPSVRATPAACLVAGQACWIHPCAEFVVPGAQRPVEAQAICDPYSSPTARATLIRR